MRSLLDLSVGDTVIKRKETGKVASKGAVTRIEYPITSGCTCYGNGGIHVEVREAPGLNGCYIPIGDIEVDLTDSYDRSKLTQSDAIMLNLGMDVMV
jgi:hypothetical protein